MSRHRARYREIADVLSRHGMGYLVGIAGLERHVPFHRGLLGHLPRDAPYTRPEHVRLALEELGATFVKLGQVLSTRPDVLGPAYQAELATLQDAAPPVPADEILRTIADELGAGVTDAFADFDPRPLAAASIGQAHAATARDGSEVVVKVRRPGVVEQVEEDLEILQNLAARAAQRWRAAAEHDIVGLADEFAQTLRAELDYLREARNAERFARNLAGDPDVVVPRVRWETTTSRVLTLDRVRGIKVSDVAALEAAGIDRRSLAERATRLTAKMVFEDGFFHADPHPGNLFIQADGRIALIDFGMAGEVDDRLRESLAGLLAALARQDADRATTAVIGLSVAPTVPDRRRLRADLAALIARYAGRALGEIRLAAAIDDVLGIVRRHRLRLPRQLALMLRMVVMNEGVAARLDPGFRPTDVLGPYARQLMARRLEPAVLARHLAQAGLDAADLGADLPALLHRLAGLVDGGVDLRLDLDAVEPLLARAERVGERIAAAVLAGAFITGLAQLMAVDPGRWRAWRGPMFGVGIGAAGALGAYVGWTGRRDARMRRLPS